MILRSISILFVGPRAAILIIGAALLTGCGGSGGARNVQSRVQVRLVHAAPHLGEITVLEDGDSVISGVTYGTASPYVEIPESEKGVFQLQIDPEFILGGPKVTEKIASPYFKTLLVTDTDGVPAITVLDDSAPDVPSGEATIRVVNANASVPSIDAYLTPTDLGSLKNRSPFVSGLALTKASDVFPTEPGDLRIRISASATTTTATTKADTTATTTSSSSSTTLPKVLLDTEDYPVEPDEELTLYFIEKRGGGKPYSALTVRAGDR